MTKNKFLLSAIFIALMSNANALDITEDFVNDGIINFESTKESEENVTVTGDNITVTNNGIILNTYQEKDNTDFNVKEKVRNGINSDGKILFLNNNGYIKGDVDLKTTKSEIFTENSSSNINAFFFTENSGNGINSALIGENTGIILGRSIEERGEVKTFTTGVFSNYGTTYAGNNGSTNRSGNGINGGLTGGNSGVISGIFLVKGGKLEANIDAIANIFTNAQVYGGYRSEKSANGIDGNFIGENKGKIFGKIFIDKKEAISNSKTAYVTAENDFKYSGNGINGELRETNSGIVSGYLGSNAGIANVNGVRYKDYESIKYSGNGIAFDGEIFNDITNSGVIKGVQSAIAAQSISGNINNYGVMAGRKIFSDGDETIKNGNTVINVVEKDLSTLTGVNDNNKGIYVKLKSEKSTEYSGKNTGKVELDLDKDVVIESITNGIGGLITLDNGTEKTVLNASVSDAIDSTGITVERTILNSLEISRTLFPCLTNLTILSLSSSV